MISFYAIKHWIYNIKSGNFIVRNSPLDIVGTLLKGSVASLRTATRFTVGTGITFALCFELDEILISEGKEPYFVPQMREILRQSGLEGQAKTLMDKVGIQDKVGDLKVDPIDTYFQNVSDADKATFETNTGIKWDDFTKAHKEAMNLKKGFNPSNTSVSSLINKEDPFNTKK